jgi:hypothetical protein
MARVSRIAAWIQGFGRLGAGLGLGAALLLAPPGCSLPTSAPDPLVDAVGVPIPRSEHPRAGQVSYRLEKVDEAPDEVRVDLSLFNGSGIPYENVTIRVVALGAAGERQGVRLPVGSLRPGSHKRISARFPPLPFPVLDIWVEVLSRS